MPKPNPPRVSVILPVYNAGRYLDAAVGSILNQTFTDLELIVIDDGSTDGSTDTLRAHDARDARIKLVCRENRGLVATLGELIALASGDLLARMDADDIALPERLETQVAFMEANPLVVCIGGGIILIDEHDQELHHPPPVTGDAHVQRSALEGRMPICHPAAMFRAEAIAKAGGYRPEAYPSEDLDLWLRLGEIGRLDNVPQAILRYRVHEASVSVQHSDRQVAKMREACESAWARRGITNGIFRGARSPAQVGAELETKPGAAQQVPQAGQSPQNPTAQSLVMASDAHKKP